MKPSESFEGNSSSLKKTFDKAVEKKYQQANVDPKTCIACCSENTSYTSEPQGWEERFDEKYKVGNTTYNFDALHSVNYADVFVLKMFIADERLLAAAEEREKMVREIGTRLKKLQYESFTTGKSFESKIDEIIHSFTKETK